MAFDQGTVDELATLNSDVANRGAWLVLYMEHFGGHVHITEGLRSPARQAALFASGRTEPGPILTNTLQSRHLTGRAFDVDFVGLHPDQVHPEWWQFTGLVGEALGLRWGGRWAMLDYRHFEG